MMYYKKKNNNLELGDTCQTSAAHAGMPLSQLLLDCLSLKAFQDRNLVFPNLLIFFPGTGQQWWLCTVSDAICPLGPIS